MSAAGPASSPMAVTDISRKLLLCISGIRFVLHGLDNPLERELRERFVLFLQPPGSAGDGADLEIRLLRSPLRQYLPYPVQGGPKEYQLETRVREGRLHAWSYSFAGRFEIEGNQGEMELCDSDFEPAHRSVENFLRVALAWKAMNRGGLLLHASGVVRRARAYLFFGPSGSGKTTVARLSSGSLLLNDDCMLLVRRGGEFLASGVPFKGAEDAGARDAGSFPIAGLFRLVQAPAASCLRLPLPRAVSEIASSVPFVTERSEGFRKIFGTLEELVRRTPVFRLEFRLSPDFWRAIEGELPEE